MEYTKNLRLSKPSYDDDVDVQIINNNMDLLDEKVGNLPYLPLKGGKMQGNITLPFDVGLTYDNNHFLNFQQTMFHNNKLTTLAMKGDRLKYYSQSGKEFVVDDTGIWFDADALIRDKYTYFEDFKGYVKLSTGLIMQWGFVNPTNSDGNVQRVTLNTPMSNPNYVVFTSRSNYTQNIKPDTDVPSNNATFNCTRTSFDILCARSSRGKAIFWLVIGR